MNIDTASQRHRARAMGENVPKRKPGKKPKNPWEWIEKSEPQKCWLWFGPMNAWGYGIFTKNKRTVRAHRAAWESVYGEIPVGMILLHSCDVRNCCNPQHLRVGTHQDNRADTVRKGRQARGMKMAAAKLTDREVIMIRDQQIAGDTQTCLAAKYGVCRRTIRNIVMRQTWKHV